MELFSLFLPIERKFLKQILITANKWYCILRSFDLRYHMATEIYLALTVLTSFNGGIIQVVIVVGYFGKLFIHGTK